jgi:hypothetical protein
MWANTFVDGKSGLLISSLCALAGAAPLGTGPVRRAGGGSQGEADRGVPGLRRHAVPDRGGPGQRRHDGRGKRASLSSFPSPAAAKSRVCSDFFLQ